MPDVNVFLFVTNLVVIALCGGLFMVMPQITRKSLLFGVKIPMEQAESREARALKKSYIATCMLGIILLLAICVVQFVFWRDLTLLAVIYIPLLIIPLFYAAFIPNWKKAVKLKAEKGWQVPNVVYAEIGSSHSRGKLHNLPWAWYIICAVAIIAYVAIVIARYDYLPDMIPRRFDESLQPIRYVEKTLLEVLMMPLITVGTLLMMVPVGVVIEKAKLQIDAAKPRLSFAQHKVYRRRMGHAMGFLTLMMITLLIAAGIPILYPVSPAVGQPLFWASMVCGVVVPVGVLVVVKMKTGQGGNKVKLAIEEDVVDITAKPMLHGRGDDKFWKLGLFYYNPSDPAYFVEDRFGTGFGLNYARLIVKIGAALLGIGLIVLCVWMTVGLI